MFEKVNTRPGMRALEREQLTPEFLLVNPTDTKKQWIGPFYKYMVKVVKREKFFPLELITTEFHGRP